MRDARRTGEMDGVERERRERMTGFGDQIECATDEAVGGRGQHNWVRLQFGRMPQIRLVQKTNFLLF